MRHTLDLQTETILPAAIEWAERTATWAATRGRGLTSRGLTIAEKVGVERPGDVRLLIVDSLPVPEGEPLRSYALRSGLLGPDTQALTIGSAILVRKGALTTRVLSHELRHVHQYERFGSIEAFLWQYLRQIATFGYADAPLEREARLHEIDHLEQPPGQKR